MGLQTKSQMDNHNLIARSIKAILGKDSKEQAYGFIHMIALLILKASDIMGQHAYLSKYANYHVKMQLDRTIINNNHSRCDSSKNEGDAIATPRSKRQIRELPKGFSKSSSFRSEFDRQRAAEKLAYNLCRAKKADDISQKETVGFRIANTINESPTSKFKIREAQDVHISSGQTIY